MKTETLRGALTRWKKLARRGAPPRSFSPTKFSSKKKKNHGGHEDSNSGLLRLRTRKPKYYHIRLLFMFSRLGKGAYLDTEAYSTGYSCKHVTIETNQKIKSLDLSHLELGMPGSPGGGPCSLSLSLSLSLSVSLSLSLSLSRLPCQHVATASLGRSSAGRWCIYKS